MESLNNRFFEITDYTVSGEGICHINNRAVFVPNTAIGDVISLDGITPHKNYVETHGVKIVTPSENRIDCDCGFFENCGGCVFRNISYDAELKFKQNLVENAFRRIGHLSPKINPIVSAENRLGYRNKAQMPFTCKNGKVCAGFFERKSHSVIPVNSCKITPDIFMQIIEVFCDFANKHGLSVYNESNGKGLLRHIYLRLAPKTGEVMVCIVVNENTLPHSDELIKILISTFPQIKSILLNINNKKTNVILGEKYLLLYGEKYITDLLCGIKFIISPDSFYQVNSAQTEKLYSLVSKYADSQNKTVLDLYCGIGSIGLTMAQKVKKLLGVEIVPSAVKNAKQNAKLNNITNAEFICGDAVNAFDYAEKTQTLPDVVILDPPRKGCDKALVDFICSKMSGGKIVYVSCNPATLARDCEIFSKSGYKTVEVTPVDMFPRTPHCESVALLVRTDSAI